MLSGLRYMHHKCRNFQQSILRWNNFWMDLIFVRWPSDEIYNRGKISLEVIYYINTRILCVCAHLCVCNFRDLGNGRS